MRESDAYRDLYQESAARKTADKSINILQGRCVGGGTTVNWTSSFRTPDATLAHWQSAHGLTGFGPNDLAPWFERIEHRLDIAPWTVTPNANNAALARGAGKLGLHWGAIRRNVKGCWNLGYCGMGCPTNAKQSMLVTTIPRALERGATLLTRARAMRFIVRGDRVESLECAAMDASGTAPTARAHPRPRAYVRERGRRHRVAGAADAQRGTGSVCHARHAHVPASERRVGRADAGASRRVRRAPRRRSIPITSSTRRRSTDRSDSSSRRRRFTRCWPRSRCPGTVSGTQPWMRRLPHMQVLIALLRDGFHPGQRRRARAHRGRRHADPRLSADAVSFRWRAPRNDRDGRDPVRRRCDGGDAGA